MTVSTDYVSTSQAPLISNVGFAPSSQKWWKNIQVNAWTHKEQLHVDDSMQSNLGSAVGPKKRMTTHTFPTAASPSKTSLMLLLGFGAAVPLVAASAILTCAYIS